MPHRIGRQAGVAAEHDQAPVALAHGAHPQVFRGTHRGHAGNPSR